jgi:hypothetical protein
VNVSDRKVSKRMKEDEFVAALLVVAKNLLQQLYYLANQDSLMAQHSLKHVELNSKLKQFNLLDIMFTNA